MIKLTIKELLDAKKKMLLQNVILNGWVKSFRSNRFIALHDGSHFSTIQIVIEKENFEEDIIKHITIGSSLSVVGSVVESQGSGQDIEIQAEKITILGLADTEEVQKTILQPKKHSLELLREQAHLRFRTQTFYSIFKVRNALSFAIHKYFNERSYFYINTPIITASDAEGAGEIFSVTNFPLNDIPKDEQGEINFQEDFFGKKTHLTVSGQLEAEAAALGLGKVYTFGPTFRAENSNTSRHLAEFWMVEPEVAFNDLEQNIDLAEDFLKYIIQYALDHCKDELEFLNKRFMDEQASKPQNERESQNLLEKLHQIIEKKFLRVSYTEAIDILKNSKPNKKKKFKYIIEEWGADLQSEHERYLVEKHFNAPVVLFDYPSKIKAFYMRLNEDGKTVRAMDILFPGIGEIIGGSQREERLEVLKSRMHDFNIDEKELWWFLETRKFGTVPHSGFGLGLERLVLFVTGMGNIRDVIPFPRTPKNAEF